MPEIYYEQGDSTGRGIQVACGTLAWWLIYNTDGATAKRLLRTGDRIQATWYVEREGVELCCSAMISFGWDGFDEDDLAALVRWLIKDLSFKEGPSGP